MEVQEMGGCFLLEQRRDGPLQFCFLIGALQQRPQIVAAITKQAETQITTGRDAQTVAGLAEILGVRGNDADFSEMFGVAEFLCRPGSDVACDR